MAKKIDITSTVVEKSIDIAEKFIGKLVYPATEELGLLAKDGVSLWRFKRNVRLFNKAKEICEKNKIDPKKLPLKLLVPFMELSSLEEDDKMHDVWATLLSNMVDSEQSLQNYVFPHLLSQISLNEYRLIEEIAKKQRTTEVNFRKLMREGYVSSKKKTKPIAVFDRWFSISMETEREWGVEARIIRKIELANLIRLGILERVDKHSIERQKRTNSIIDFFSKNAIKSSLDSNSEYIQVLNSKSEYYFTDLGIKFILACLEKDSN